ncbi:MAG: hypothetical protein JOZ17_09685 [Acetobacteraceae bacterium]|nr:hypothetical protein [Acetobacteraceae bacterium]
MKCIVVGPTTCLCMKKRVCIACTIGLLLVLSACAGGYYQPGYDANLPQYNVPDGGH